jgi:hypothetical protein
VATAWPSARIDPGDACALAIGVAAHERERIRRKITAHHTGGHAPLDAPFEVSLCREGWRDGDEAEPVTDDPDHRDFEGA